MNERLELPKPSSALPAFRPLTMDEYLDFVLHNLRHVEDQEATRQRKRDLSPVPVPFEL